MGRNRAPPAPGGPGWDSPVSPPVSPGRGHRLHRPLPSRCTPRSNPAVSSCSQPFTAPRDPTALPCRCAPRDPIPAVPAVTLGPPSSCWPRAPKTAAPDVLAGARPAPAPAHSPCPPRHPRAPHTPPSPGYFYPPFSSLLLQFHPDSVTFTTSFIPAPDSSSLSLRP